MRYVTGIDEQGEPIDVKDPMAARLRQIADGAGRDAGKLATGLMAVQEVFGNDLPADPAFTGPVTDHLEVPVRAGIGRNGAATGALASRVTPPPP